MSKSAKNLNDIVSKLHEVDNVFRFGEKMIPVIEGFVSFISDFIPFVEQVSGSIQDSRSKIPEASTQLEQVTSASELATTEMLDKIDNISSELQNITNCIDEIIEHRTKVEELAIKLQSEISDNPNAQKLLNELLSQVDVSLTLEQVKNRVNTITSETDQLTMSLQIQDITAQQLAAVNHLIISVQQKLGGLLSAVDSAAYNPEEELEHKKLPDVDFDANASSRSQTNDQDIVDSIVNNEKTTQEEIDKLFS